MQGGIFKRPFLARLRSVFDDQAMPVAETATIHGSMGGCPQWRRVVWASLPPLTQQDCLDFVAARTLKRKQVESSITPERVSFAREFFVPCHEASLIRPLCLMLEFVRAEDGIDLRAGGWKKAKHQFEGSFKGADLLHPWPEALGPRSTGRSSNLPTPRTLSERVSSCGAQTASSGCWSCSRRWKKTLVGGVCLHGAAMLLGHGSRHSSTLRALRAALLRSHWRCCVRP